MTYPTIALRELSTDMRSGFACGDEDPDGVVQFRMNNVTRDGNIDWSKVRRIPRTKHRKGLELAAGDILFNATNSPELVGKTALFSWYGEPVSFSNHFIRVSLDRTRAEPAFVSRWLQRKYAERLFEGLCRQWVNQASVTKDQLANLEIPIPPLEEQRRIAAILDQADALCRKRREAVEVLGKLPQAVYDDTFGDPIRNPRQWPTKSLTELCHCYSGGTPSKSNDTYWRGSLPWFSAKDLKEDDLFDSIDHINPEVTRTSSLSVCPMSP